MGKCKILDLCRVHPESSGESPRAFGRSFLDSNITSAAVFQNAVFFSNRVVSWHPWGCFSLTGPHFSGRLGPFLLPLHGAKHSSSILPRFELPGRGRTGDQTPCTRRPSGGSILTTFRRFSLELHRPQPMQTRRKFKNDPNQPLDPAGCLGKFGLR